MNGEGKGTIRKAFIMRVNPGQEREYERRHRPIWPEMEEALIRSGVRTYSIFLDPDTHQLFAYVEFENEEQWKAVSRTAACQGWWKYMRDIMPSNTDNSPISKEMREVFHIEG